MSSRILLAAVCFVKLAAVCTAQDLAPIVFPDVEGWAKGTRYDEAPPRGRVPRSSINYTTKAKVGKDYVRADAQVTLAGGKDVKELLPDFEKMILENPVQKDSKKIGSGEVKVGERTVTRSRFSSSFGANNPVETELYVISYGKHVIRVEHTGTKADSEARTAEVGKLVEAIVEAAK